MKSCRLLLVNGTHDGLIPIEDSMLMMEYGSPKEARLFTGLAHMGYPPANGTMYPWMEAVMASAGAWKTVIPCFRFQCAPEASSEAGWLLLGYSARCQDCLCQISSNVSFSNPVYNI